MQFVKGGPDIPERLLQAHEDGSVVFFCGAGISYPARLPGFKDLVDQLYSRLHTTLDPIQTAAIRDKRYDTAVSLLETRILDGRRKVRREISKILVPDLSARDATATHDALLTLGKNRKGQTRLITTNFDRLFEHVIDTGSHPVERYQAPLLPVPKNRWDGLVYLHGLLPDDSADSGLDSLVVSSGDFGLAYLTERWAARFVGELLRNFNVCFVGYSIDDPVLRYMMDALAADRALGEATREMFAFGSYSIRERRARADEWRAKNVRPILYREHWRHAYLHRTLRAWADTHRDGARGKEQLVTEYAMARPGTATGHDDFVGRMLWALSDPTGLPAKRFAEENPAPSLDWLEPFTENRFRHIDLIRFGVPPKEREDKTLKFSLLRRPAPYDLAPYMALADIAGRGSGHDSVMQHLTRWLMRHLNDPALLVWLVKQGGELHANLAVSIARRMNELFDLQDAGKQDTLDSIHSDAPNAIPGSGMRTLWELLLADKIKLVEDDVDFYRWRSRFARYGMTTGLRLELLGMLAPGVSIRGPAMWPIDDEDEEQEHIRQLVEWDIVLRASPVHVELLRLREDEKWADALPTLLGDFTGLLRDALDLMKALGRADDKSDWSYLNQPSISEHAQNHGFQDWTVLVDLNRDAWLATAAESRERARRVAESWSHISFPLFKRLAFFAAAQGETVPLVQAFEWLLKDRHWWLWSIETQREAMRLLVTLAPRLGEKQLLTLERAILAGPPREMFKADLEEERWERIVHRETWLRLAKLSDAGAQLSATARETLEALSSEYPTWSLAEDQREEFPSWIAVTGEFISSATTPRDRDELLEWLRNNPEPDHSQRDDWSERCRDDFEHAADALSALAEEGTWPTGRWREALIRWSEDELAERSWREMAPVLAHIPTEALQELSHGVSWWLQTVARVFQGQQETFLSLCDRVLAVEHRIHGDDDDPVELAINHPVGLVTDALLRWWYRRDLQDQQGLADELRSRFSQLADTEVPGLLYGRILLAANVISLFRVDREWTTQFMAPLFDWERSAIEARSAWKGFLWSPRLYDPLLVAIKSQFLDTANRYTELGQHGRQYVSLLTFIGLDPGDVFTNSQLAHAMQALPREALEHAANTLYRAVDSAGDKRADFWNNRAARLLESIWPKTLDVNSETVTTNLAFASLAAGDAFPEALELVDSWMQPLQYPDRVAYPLHKAKIDKRFSEPSLDLLSWIVGDQARGDFPSLRDCLSEIRRAQAELEQDPRFQRLLEIVRANGGDID